MNLNEVTNIKFKDYVFQLKLDVNEDPTKKGLKIHFVPDEGDITNPDIQDEIAIELQKVLDAGLDKYGMQVERDRQLKDQTIIAFFVYIEYFDELIQKALQLGSKEEAEEESEETEEEL